MAISGRRQARTSWSRTCTWVLAGALGAMVQCSDGDRSRAEAPFRHVLLISIDTCRADRLSCYGYRRRTSPHIDELAREGVVFENALAPVPVTLPSHCTMLTGTNPPYHGVHDNVDYRLGLRNVTLAEWLKKRGFATGAVIAAKVLASRYAMDQGFDAYLDRFDSEKSEVGIPQRIGEEASREALRWLEANHGKPFFLFLHYYDPHQTYAPPEPFATQYKDDRYAGEIAYVDRCIGQVVQKLKQWDIYDQTLIIITSDHGEMLGEHAELSHGFFIYRSALHVPLIFRLPGQRGGRRVEQLVGIVDIVPTVCALAGIEPPAQLHGHDLSGFVNGGPLPPRDRLVYCESLVPTKYDTQGLVGLVAGGWKYIQTTRPELYDLVRDPGESHNLAAQEQERAAQMRQRMRELLDRQLRRDGDGSRLQAEPGEVRRLQALGYVADAAVQEHFGFGTDRDDPKDVIGFHNKVVMVGHMLHTKRYAAAERLCRKLIEARPNYCGTLAHLGHAVALQGRHEEAIPYFEAVLEAWRDPDRHDQIRTTMVVEASVGLGRAYRRRGQLERAEGFFRQAIEIWPELTKGHLALGTLLLDQGRVAEAAPHLRRATQLDPDHTGAHHRLADALLSLGRHAEAQHHYRRALALNSDLAEAHSHLADALRATGHDDEAVPHYREALRLKPQLTETREKLGAVLEALARSAEARAPQPMIEDSSAGGRD